MAASVVGRPRKHVNYRLNINELHESILKAKQWCNDKYIKFSFISFLTFPGGIEMEHSLKMG